jgi:hypothetical protein
VKFLFDDDSIGAVMNRKHPHVLAMITAVLVAVTGALACSGSAAGAAPGEISSGGLHLIASVNFNSAVPAGGDTAPGVPFSHTAKVSGDYSITLDGDLPLRGGQIAVGYIVGCAVDMSNGFGIGISPTIGSSVAVSPSAAVTLMMNAPPSVTLDISSTFSVNTSVSGLLTAVLAPGAATAVVVAAADLDQNATFPYTFTHTNTPLNVSACLLTPSAMPFITVRADTAHSTAQTTGYGAVFTF